MGRWRRVMWCSVCMPRECVLIISSRAWWWCGAGRAGGRSRSLVLSETGGEAGSWCVTRKWCARSSGRSTEGRRKDHPEVVRWLGSRRRPPSWRSAVSVAAAAGAGSLWRRASTKVYRSIPSASCLRPPASCPDDEAGWRSLWRESTKVVFPCSISLLPASRAGGLSPGSAPAGVK